MSAKKIFEINVKVKISVVIIGSDTSILGIDLPNGYNLNLKKLKDFYFEKKIKTGDGKLSSKYHFAKISKGSEEEVKILCLEKSDSISIIEEFNENAQIRISDEYLPNHTKLKEYANKEFEIINNLISALQVFKNGDITINEVFIKFDWNFIINSTHTKTILIEDANTLCPNKYTLTTKEIAEFKVFILEFNKAFIFMKDIISNYTYAKKLLSKGKASEVLVTTLEMAILAKHQQGKKEALSKRVSVFLSNDDGDLSNIYCFMKLIYKKRSESTHEGIIDNVIDEEFRMLEEITRQVIKKLIKYSNLVATEQTAEYKDIRLKLIASLKSKVTEKNDKGFFQI